MTESQRETRIAACARHLEAAHAAGDCVTARNWLHVMELAEKERSPEQLARMRDCYFSSEGQQARRAALVRCCA